MTASITCMSKRKKRYCSHVAQTKKLLIICLWLVFWQTSAFVVHNSIMLVGPFGILLGALAYAVPLLEEILEPFMLFLKAVPVASFIILVLIWAGSRNLSVVISFLVVLPVIYVNTIAGLKSTDWKLLEMAEVFHMPVWKRIRFIYLPALMPYLLSGCRIALGMSWKSGAAAEVIGLPEHSIGEQLYLAKIYLETTDLFAWTMVIILISAVFERLVLFSLSRLCPQKGEGKHEAADS